jgi:hypothetical protein
LILLTTRGSMWGNPIHFKVWKQKQKFSWHDDNTPIAPTTHLLDMNTCENNKILLYFDKLHVPKLLKSFQMEYHIVGFKSLESLERWTIRRRLKTRSTIFKNTYNATTTSPTRPYSWSMQTSWKTKTWFVFITMAEMPITWCK